MSESLSTASNKKEKISRKQKPIHQKLWKFKALPPWLDSAAVGLTMLPKPWRIKLPVWGLEPFSCQHVIGLAAGAISGFINSIDLWADLIANFNRVCDYQHRNWDCCPEFCTPMGGSRQRDEYLFCYYYCHRSAVISAPLNVIFWGESDRYRLGVTHCLQWS